MKLCDLMEPESKKDQPPAKRHFIKQWRKKRGMTQEALAEITGMTNGNISLIENFTSGFSEKTLNKIADALDVTRGQLLEVDPNQDTQLWSIFEQIMDLDEAAQAEIVEITQTLINQKGKQTD